MSKDGQEKIFTMEMVRFLNILSEYEKTNTVPAFLKSNPEFLNEELISQIKQAKPNASALVDSLIAAFNGATSLQDKTNLAIIRMTFNDYYRQCKVQHLSFVPDEVIENYRPGVSHVTVLFVEIKAMMPILKHHNKTPEQYLWILGVVLHDTLYDKIMSCLSHDLSILTEFMSWYHKGVAKDIEHEPAEVYYARNLINDIKSYRRILRDLKDFLEG